MKLQQIPLSALRRPNPSGSGASAGKQPSSQTSTRARPGSALPLQALRTLTPSRKSKPEEPDDPSRPASVSRAIWNKTFPYDRERIAELASGYLLRGYVPDTAIILSEQQVLENPYEGNDDCHGARLLRIFRHAWGERGHEDCEIAAFAVKMMFYARANFPGILNGRLVPSQVMRFKGTPLPDEFSEEVDRITMAVAKEEADEIERWELKYNSLDPSVDPDDSSTWRLDDQ